MGKKFCTQLFLYGWSSVTMSLDVWPQYMYNQMSRLFWHHFLQFFFKSSPKFMFYVSFPKQSPVAKKIIENWERNKWNIPGFLIKKLYFIEWEVYLIYFTRTPSLSFPFYIYSFALHNDTWHLCWCFTIVVGESNETYLTSDEAQTSDVSLFRQALYQLS